MQLDIRLARFRPMDQTPARSLILAGLAERWGALDESRNPDLNDIASAYATGIVLCAWSGETLVGTGALVPREAGVVEIVRMSVARDWRRNGVGRRIAEALLAEARNSGARRVVLETTETWVDAVAFYLRLGFTITHHLDGDAYFALDLSV